jgi:cell division septal protein FtsQ
MEDRIPPLKIQEKETKKSSPVAKFMITLFFLSLLIILFLRSPFSKITQIEVTGNQLLSKQEILKQAKVTGGESFFRINSAEIKKRISQLPEVKSVEVSKFFPNQLKIKITEQQMIAYVRTSDQQLLPVLENGMLITDRSVTSQLESKTIFENWDVNSEVFRQVVKGFHQLSPELRKLVLVIRPVPDEPDQVCFLTSKHKIFMRINEIYTKMKIYPHFQHHPQGNIYLLETNWFSPD